MKIYVVFAVCTALFAGIFCQDTTTQTSDGTSASVETTTLSTTTEVTTLTPETTEITTVSSVTTEITTASSVTTEAPTTSSVTTEAPTTSSVTTEAPTTSTKSTTSSVPPTTSPQPITTSAPPPDPIEGSWNVTNGNITCIRLDLKSRFLIPVGDKKEIINLSPNATVSGDCSESNITQEITLTDLEYVLTLTFEKDSSLAFVKNVTLSYNLPDVAGNVYNDSHSFSVKSGNSYLCSSTLNLMLKNVTMEIMKIQVQSFGTKQDLDYGTIEECEADNKVSDIVPIAVGIALLALVVVVLIAYFIGRRRSRQMGYQSV